MATAVHQHPIIQRPLRGSRISTFYPVKSLPSLSSLDSAFQLQEYLSLLIRLDVHDVDTITTLPGITRDVKEKASDKAGDGEAGQDTEREGEGEKEEKEATVDEACWIYEQLRRLAQDLTHPLITTLQQECSRSTCPEMKAGEWLYLCVAHGNDGATEQCCAIDYVLHTLDSATALLNSPRAFPSRMQIPPASHRHFSSLARRLGRIFAHAFFHHREAFEQAEAESSLYARFLALTRKFDLVPSEFLVIPPTGDYEDEDEEHSRDSGFGLREAKFGTSYDHRRGLGQHHQHQQLLNDSQDDYLSIPRARRTMHQVHNPYEIQTHLQGPGGSSGSESPRRVGRNRTDTMVHSEMASLVDDLARAAATAVRVGERERERQERREREREGKERERAESEVREKIESEERERAETEDAAEAKQEAEAGSQHSSEALASDNDDSQTSATEPPTTEEVDHTTNNTVEEVDMTQKADEPSPSQVEPTAEDAVESTPTEAVEENDGQATDVQQEIITLPVAGEDQTTEPEAEAEEPTEGEDKEEDKEISEVKTDDPAESAKDEESDEEEVATDESNSKSENV